MVVVGFVERWAFVIETVAPVSQLPETVLVVDIIFACALGLEIVGARAIVSIVTRVSVSLLTGFQR